MRKALRAARAQLFDTVCISIEGISAETDEAMDRDAGDPDARDPGECRIERRRRAHLGIITTLSAADSVGPDG